MINWMAIHGNLSLALRHPKNYGPSRALVETILKILEGVFIERDFADEEDIDHIHKTEQNARRNQVERFKYYSPN